MTKFIASVMSVEEARIAFECGAGIIDCKDPSSGALGALRDETIAAIVKYVDGRRPVSATIGDLPMAPDVIRAAVKAKIETGVDYVKIGIFCSSHRRSLPRNAIRGTSELRETGRLDTPWIPASAGMTIASSSRRLPRTAIRGTPGPSDFAGAGYRPRIAVQDRRRNGGPIEAHLEQCFATVQTFACQTSLIAVLFADRNLDMTLLPGVAGAGFTGVMLDTANKSGGGLTSVVSHALLARFVSTAQESGLTAGLAGSLKIEDVPRLLELSPDYLGFRSALCTRNRTSSIARAKVTAVRRSMQALIFL